MESKNQLKTATLSLAIRSLAPLSLQNCEGAWLRNDLRLCIAALRESALGHDSEAQELVSEATLDLEAHCGLIAPITIQNIEEARLHLMLFTILH